MDSRSTISLLFILSASAGIVFNGFILLVLLWQRRIHTPSHLLLLHLAILDTLFCFAVITFTSLSYSLATSSSSSPFASSLNVAGDVSSSPSSSSSSLVNLNLTTLLQVQQFTWITLLGTLMWTLTGLSCDRYTAICFPFTYSQLVSRKKVLALIATSWISSLVLSTIPIVFKSTANSCIQSMETLYSTSNVNARINGNAFTAFGKPASDLCFPFSLDPTFLVLSLPLSSSASPEVSFTLHHHKQYDHNHHNPPPAPPPPPQPPPHPQAVTASSSSSSSASASFASSFFSSTLPLISSSVWPNVANSNGSNVNLHPKQLTSSLTADDSLLQMLPTSNYEPSFTLYVVYVLILITVNLVIPIIIIVSTQIHILLIAKGHRGRIVTVSPALNNVVTSNGLNCATTDSLNDVQSPDVDLNEISVVDQVTTKFGKKSCPNEKSTSSTTTASEAVVKLAESLNLMVTNDQFMANKSSTVTAGTTVTPATNNANCPALTTATTTATGSEVNSKVILNSSTQQEGNCQLMNSTTSSGKCDTCYTHHNNLNHANSLIHMTQHVQRGHYFNCEQSHGNEIHKLTPPSATAKSTTTTTTTTSQSLKQQPQQPQQPRTTSPVCPHSRTLTVDVLRNSSNVLSNTNYHQSQPFQHINDPLHASRINLNTLNYQNQLNGPPVDANEEFISQIIHNNNNNNHNNNNNNDDDEEDESVAPGAIKNEKIQPQKPRFQVNRNKQVSTTNSPFDHNLNRYSNRHHHRRLTHQHSGQCEQNNNINNNFTSSPSSRDGKDLSQISVDVENCYSTCGSFGSSNSSSCISLSCDSTGSPSDPVRQGENGENHHHHQHHHHHHHHHHKSKLGHMSHQHRAGVATVTILIASLIFLWIPWYAIHLTETLIVTPVPLLHKSSSSLTSTLSQSMASMESSSSHSTPSSFSSSSSPPPSLNYLSVHSFILLCIVSVAFTLIPTVNAYVYGVKSRLLRQTFKRLLQRYIYQHEASMEIERRISLRSQSINSTGTKFSFIGWHTLIRPSSLPATILVNSASKFKVRRNSAPCTVFHSNFNSSGYYFRTTQTPPPLTSIIATTNTNQSVEIAMTDTELVTLRSNLPPTVNWNHHHHNHHQQHHHHHHHQHHNEMVDTYTCTSQLPGQKSDMTSDEVVKTSASLVIDPVVKSILLPESANHALTWCNSTNDQATAVLSSKAAKTAIAIASVSQGNSSRQTIGKTVTFGPWRRFSVQTVSPVVATAVATDFSSHPPHPHQSSSSPFFCGPGKSSCIKKNNNDQIPPNVDHSSTLAQCDVQVQQEPGQGDADEGKEEGQRDQEGQEGEEKQDVQVKDEEEEEEDSAKEKEREEEDEQLVNNSPTTSITTGTTTCNANIAYSDDERTRSTTCTIAAENGLSHEDAEDAGSASCTHGNSEYEQKFQSTLVPVASYPCKLHQVTCAHQQEEVEASSSLATASTASSSPSPSSTSSPSSSSTFHVNEAKSQNQAHNNKSQAGAIHLTSQNNRQQLQSKRRMSLTINESPGELNCKSIHHRHPNLTKSSISMDDDELTHNGNNCNNNNNNFCRNLLTQKSSSSLNEVFFSNLPVDLSSCISNSLTDEVQLTKQRKTNGEQVKHLHEQLNHHKNHSQEQFTSLNTSSISQQLFLPIRSKSPSILITDSKVNLSNSKKIASFNSNYFPLNDSSSNTLNIPTTYSRCNNNQFNLSPIYERPNSIVGSPSTPDV